MIKNIMFKPIFNINQKVNHIFLLENPSTNVEKNLDKVCRIRTSISRNGISIYEGTIVKFSAKESPENSNEIYLLAPLNQKAMQEQIAPLKQELLKYVLNPLRLRRLSDRLCIDLATLLSFYNY